MECVENKNNQRNVGLLEYEQKNLDFDFEPISIAMSDLVEHKHL